MRTRKLIVAGLLSMALLGSCGTMSSLNVARRATEIQAGMTTADVQKLMGRPDYRRFDASRSSWEQWEYRGMFFDDARDIVVIDFIDGTVVSLNSFSELRHPSPPEPSSGE